MILKHWRKELLIYVLIYKVDGSKTSQFHNGPFLRASQLLFATLLYATTFSSTHSFNHTHINPLSLTLFLLLLLYSFFFLCVLSFLLCVCGNITMTDITDDIAEEISFQGFEDDCKLLGNLLNDILQREAGSTFVDKLEKIRVLSQVLIFLFFFLFT